MSQTAFEHQQPQIGLGTRIKSLLLEKLGSAMVGMPRHGAITVTLPSGRTRTLGDPKSGLHAFLRLKNFKVLKAAMRRGTLGFAEAYMQGDIEIKDLTTLFRFFLLNREVFFKANPGIFQRAAHDLAWHMSRPNTKEGSQKNISEHYDLGNDFYAEWLDPSMTYSSAYFAGQDIALEEAQRAKYQRIMVMAGITRGSHVLEIGCGWGGFAEMATRSGANVRGITLSREQLKYGVDRLERQGLDDLGTLVFEDYRDTRGAFDHVVSIEMIEAVGEEHWPDYFRTVHDRLKPGGTAAIQAITIAEPDFPDYKAHPDFIQRYVFPGGMLLTKTVMKDVAEKAGLVLEQVDNFRLDYAKTLRLWRDAFLERWPVIEQLGYDEIFKRKWLYYLSYCEAGFAEGTIDVGIYQYRRV
ncbi:SAM-dependent methyltransferase [Pelagibacterium luteolum]|uniref:Cyclopropane-fatty-acyl-phospholipid synthase n=1 Tax=Pelagibacterium luteolum TaxID=440168 RepID=A0A1G7WDX7_9HYPH|nr:cyclopropane-fatty-acyl-phospholipid synthase family protein [Pelagibacterium luteolum]SDG70217.1 cyclopropane-fatty-acyl-phospholipid synthase [Pelagibacterium luteolum]